MQKHTGKHYFGYGRHSSTPVPSIRWLATSGILLQLFIAYRLLFPATNASTNANCSAVHVGTTGNIYISQPEGNRSSYPRYVGGSNND